MDRARQQLNPYGPVPDSSPNVLPFPAARMRSRLAAFMDSHMADAARHHTHSFVVRHYRWAIYLLLLAVIGAGIGVSMVMAHTADAIRHAAGPLVQHGVAGASPQAMQDVAALLREDGMINRNVERIARLVHWFNFLALATAAFLLYHVWARFRSEDALAHQAAHDPLTGLGHRRSFERRLAQLRTRPHAVVLASIDRFERVAGAYGHEFADHLTVGVAERIRTSAHDHGGEVYRLDSGSFVLLYPHGLDSVQFNDALSALRREMASPFIYRAHEVFPRLSFGAVAYPRHGVAPAALLRNADAALQSARVRGGVLVTYSEELNAEAERRFDLEAQLVHAIERGELVLHFQPQQHLSSGRLQGFEALVRWRRNGQLVSPAEFIPVAEESGLVIAIGDWVLEEACRHIRALQQSGRPLVVAVNISPRQFLHPSFALKIETLLAHSGIDPSLLELEITEGAVMEQTEHAINLLHHLRELGLKLSIDDFGTGYSSLAYLKRFPIDKLKIDQSFVRQLRPGSQDAAIVQAVIGLGRSLGIQVIAEGVETVEQREWLRRLGCDEIQGYLYGKPMPGDDALAFAQGKRAA